MAGDNSRKFPSSVHQVYDKVPAKIHHTLFCKSVDFRKNDSARFDKIWGELAVGKRHVHVIYTGKLMNPNCSFYHAQAKEMDTQYAAKIFTVLEPGMEYIW